MIEAYPRVPSRTGAFWLNDMGSNSNDSSMAATEEEGDVVVWDRHAIGRLLDTREPQTAVLRALEIWRRIWPIVSTISEIGRDLA